MDKRGKGLKRWQANVRKFKNLDRTIMGLEPGEEIKHCIDSKSFDGRYYQPHWVVSNKGRVWSLKKNAWLVPQVMKGDKQGKNRYWGIEGSNKKNIYVHCLVCNYFRAESDCIALEEFGEKNVEAHHIIALHIPDHYKGKNRKEEKIKRCMIDSCKANLIYQESSLDHKNDTSMSNGGITSQEKEGTQWSQDLQDTRSMMYRSGQLHGNAYGTYYTYSRDENGALKKELHQSLKMKGLLNKYDVEIGGYRVNANENMDFIAEHEKEILNKIELDPPKSHQSIKGFILDGISVVYALKR